MNEDWKCTGASYERKLQGYEIVVDTFDGESWTATVRGHLSGDKWRLVVEVVGLSSMSVAKSVAADLYQLATTIRRADTAIC